MTILKTSIISSISKPVAFLSVRRQKIKFQLLTKLNLIVFVKFKFAN